MKSELLKKLNEANPTSLSNTFKRKEITTAAKSMGYDDKQINSFLNKELYKTPTRGVYSFVIPPIETLKQKIQSSDTSSIPTSSPSYIKWGHHEVLKKIVESGKFFPVYIAGESGNGKTVMVSEVCAETSRKLIRIQISPDTDEEDLIGHYTLKNGETVFEKGPVVKAMEEGAIILIDELDRGTNKCMCLQGVCEGKPIYLKKTGEMVYPAPGFNVIATANTKGGGDINGKYSAASIIDSAFLERFVITIEQEYPNKSVESNILKSLPENGLDGKSLEWIVNWANDIRKSYNNGACDETISTRRLIHISSTNIIIQDLKKSVEYCIARFDDETKDTFMKFFEHSEPIDENVEEQEINKDKLSSKEVDLDDIINQYKAKLNA